MSVDTSELPGEEEELVVLTESDHPFARALAGAIDPPYRAIGVRRGDRWNVGARSIEVAALPEVDGHELTLTVRDGASSLEVDGRPSLFGVDAVAALAEGRFGSFVVQGRHIAGDTWEIDVSPL